MPGLYDGQQDILGMLREVIREETRWLRHYMGQVIKNQDPDKLNRVCVIIPELNMTDEKIAFWAYPRDVNGITVPAIGSFVEIYFMNGSPSRPVYLGIAWEGYQTSPVKNYDGKPATHVIFEDPKSKDSYLKYSDKMFDFSKILALDVANKALTILEGTEPFVLGNAFKTYFDTHTHPDPVSGNSGVPSVPMPPTTLSQVIKGK